MSVRASGSAPDVREYAGGTWRELAWEHVGGAAVAESVAVGGRSEQPSMPSGRYGSRDGRPSAPDDAVLEAHAAVYRIDIPEWVDEDAVLRIRWAGDVAQLRVDGVTATDRFWDGSDLVANLRDIGASASTRVELHVLPLRRDSGVHLPADAAARLAASGDGLCASTPARSTSGPSGARRLHDARSRVTLLESVYPRHDPR